MLSKFIPLFSHSHAIHLFALPNSWKVGLRGARQAARRSKAPHKPPFTFERYSVIGAPYICKAKTSNSNYSWDLRESPQQLLQSTNTIDANQRHSTAACGTVGSCAHSHHKFYPFCPTLIVFISILFFDQPCCRRRRLWAKLFNTHA